MKSCKDTEHSFVALDMTERGSSLTVISPKYVLFCQKCGTTIDPTQKEMAVGA